MEWIRYGLIYIVNNYFSFCVEMNGGRGNFIVDRLDIVLEMDSGLF